MVVKTTGKPQKWAQQKKDLEGSPSVQKRLENLEIIAGIRKGPTS